MGRELELDENERVREALNTLLHQHDDNQTALAKTLGVQPATINQVVSGKNGASFKLAKAVAKAVGVAWPDLLTGRRPPPSVEGFRYPNLANVLSAPVAALLAPEVLAYLRGISLKGDDLPESAWLEEAVQAQSRFHRGLPLVPPGDAQASLKEAEDAQRKITQRWKNLRKT